MESAITLDQGLSPAAAWEPSELAREALEGLPVAVALAVSRGGSPEPELIHGNRVFQRLTGRCLTSAACCRLGDLASTRRSVQDEQRLQERFAAGQAAAENLLLRGAGPDDELVCEWTPLRALDGGSRAWSVTLTRRDAMERETVERLLLRSEQEAAHSRALLVEAIESMTDGFVWFGNDGRLVLCNRKYRDLYPKLAGDLKVGASYTELMKLAFERGQFNVLAGDERAAREGLPKFPNFRTMTSEGRWIEAHNHVLEAGGFIGIRFDVTAQVAAEQALKESEQRFRDFAQSGPGGFWEMDGTLRFSSFLDVRNGPSRSRPTAGEATGCALWELFADDTLPRRFWSALREEMDARQPIEDLRLVYKSPEGGRYHWRFNGTPWYDCDGLFRGYRGVAEDESAEVEARRRAEAAEERLTDAIESISGGFALFDGDDRLVLCNEIYRSGAFGDGLYILKGVSFEDIARANAYGGCVAGLDGEAEREAWIERRVAAHRAAQGSFEIDWHDGRTYLMTDRRTHDGGIATISADITELRLARENAERANRAKTRFLAAASHDLRQPLHAIELFVAALEATWAGEETQAIVGDLREACNAAGRLLNALLDISELESGKLVPRFADFPVQELLDHMARVYGPQARARGLTLRLVRCGEVIRSDPHLLERIVGNLLSNAVRYTPQGRILLGCRRRRGKLRIEVWDTGLGIPEEERPRIFDEFHQVGNAARERGRGVGLGLAIVRRLAGILGHEIFLDALRRRGSVFAVELDLADGAAAPSALRTRALRDAAVPRQTTVLVIDDDRQIRKGMARALETWGCTVRTAGDYDAAAAIVTAAPAGIDLIVTDYRLPRACNGAKAAGRLRALCRRSVPVLIVTADQGEAELREIADQGFPALQKPVDPDALRGAIASLIEDFAVPAPDAARI